MSNEVSAPGFIVVIGDSAGGTRSVIEIVASQRY